MTDAEKKLLTEIITAIESINDYLGGKRNFEGYKKNKMQRRAVERELEIIGEAMNNFFKIGPICSAFLYPYGGGPSQQDYSRL